MKKLKHKKLIAFSLVILVFLTATSVFNLPLLLSPTKSLLKGETGFSDYVKNVQTAYTSDFNGKDFYVNINGLFAKLTGRTVYNETAKLKNGMLINNTLEKTDMTKTVVATTEFSEYLTKRGCEYLYVNVPYKIDSENSLLPDGVENYANINSDELLSGLEKNGVNTLDLRPYIAKTAEDVSRNFYRTDHHWNSLGAFEAFKQINVNIEDLMKIQIDEKYIDINNWTATTYKDWFLGSLGKRVGKYFAGTDDVTYYTPNFSTDISTYITNHKTFKTGDFEQSVMKKYYFENGKNYFGDNVYCMYIGGDYPLVKHTNNSAAVNKKVLIIKDSFTLPVQAYMTTVYSEVEVLDPRYFTECTVAEYVELSNPDLVISMVNPSVFSSEEYSYFGVEKAEKISLKSNISTVFQGQNIEVKQSQSNHNNFVVSENLSPDTKYKISLQDITFTSGTSKGATVLLYDVDTETILSSHVFDIKYCRKTDNFEWSFLTPEQSSGNLQLLVYAGLHGQTAGNTAVWHNVTLEKFY